MMILTNFLPKVACTKFINSMTWWYPYSREIIISGNYVYFKDNR